MQRWVLVRDGFVRGYMLIEQSEPTEEQKRQLCFGDAEDTRDLEPEGGWVLAPSDLLVGDDWLFDGVNFTEK